MNNNKKCKCDMADICRIGLLGYAKYSIVEAKEMEEMPKKYRKKLYRAYFLIEDVQKYLYQRRL